MITKLPIKTPLMRVMYDAVRKAARGLVRDFGEVSSLQISKKGAVNFVTEADLKSEEILQRELGKARPRFGFLMEEGGEIIAENAEYRWVIDPLDGTTNFIHGVPYFAISVAVEKMTNGGGEIVAGIVYDPIHDELFMAEKGEGAFVNQRRLRVSQRQTDFYFVTGTARITSDYGKLASAITLHASSKVDAVLRRSGAAALDLAYVAAGRYDACWFPRLQKWDMAAGIILVNEAGGGISAIGDDGKTAYATGAILASTGYAKDALDRRFA